MAVVSKTQIANLALSHMREKGLEENIETSTSVAGKKANLWFDPARRQALADFDYGFARKRFTLTTHSEDPPAMWSFRYEWPANCLQPRRIEHVSGRGQPPVPFEIELADNETRSILTDAENAVLVYTRDLENVTFFPPHFVLAVSYLLAHFISGPITGKKSIQDDMLTKYIIAGNSGAALEANATAAGTEGWPEAPSILARQG